MDQRTRVGHNPRQALGRLPLLQRHKPLHTRPRADQSTHELPEFPKSWTVLGKSQGSIPPDELATHHQYGSIGVRSRSFVEQVDGGFRRVEYYHVLTQYVDVCDVP